MLVYGDDERQVRAGEIAVDIVRQLRALERERGLTRHAALVGAFIEAGELVQGLADAEFAERGTDEISSLREAGGNLLLMLAHTLAQSWESGFTHSPTPPPECFALLEQLASPQTLRLRRPEGYAFYALYPEAYLEAARCSGLSPDTVVIGIRSIGTGLAAMVAAGLGAAPPVTVRPVGHPYQRRINAGPALAQHLLHADTASFAVVDEGPGLSGSSFGGVLDWLEAHGVSRERCHVFPGHGGDPGPQASAGHRARWREVARHAVPFEDLLLGQAKRLEGWVSAVAGPLTGPLEEISGGVWRQHHYASDDDWPPVDTQLERRKFLARTKDGMWLAKFAGLGAMGEDKLALAERLAGAGFTVQPAGLAHGFLVEPWIEGTPLDSTRHDRSRLVAHLGAYLGFRAGLAAMAPGASLAELFTMAVHNTREALGNEMAETVAAHIGGPGRFADAIHPVVTDNRLHAWEWLVTPEGRLIKTDALDHHAAHDLVGCQDIAWDIAGAVVEFDLSRAERAHLASAVGTGAGRRIDAGLLRVLEPCYIAFQIGLWTFAAGSAPETEAGRIEKTLSRYAARLRRCLKAHAAA